jgi:cytidylate kinase
MNATLGLDRCLSFINCQLQPPTRHEVDGGGTGTCAVTISRQSGCGAHVFGEKLIDYFQRRTPRNGKPWTIFDRDLVEAVLQDHGLPARLARFMPEDRVSHLEDIIQDIFSLHPPTEILVRQTSETILHLAELGNVVILGRGGSVITARLPHVVNVRLVAPLEERVAHMHHFDKLDRKHAMERIEREDNGRRRYLKKYFAKDIDDPLLYHLVINTGSVTLQEAAEIVGEVACARQTAHKT